MLPSLLPGFPAPRHGTPRGPGGDCPQADPRPDLRFRRRRSSDAAGTAPSGSLARGFEAIQGVSPISIAGSQSGPPGADRPNGRSGMTIASEIHAILDPGV